MDRKSLFLRQPLAICFFIALSMLGCVGASRPAVLKAGTQASSHSAIANPMVSTTISPTLIKLPFTSHIISLHRTRVQGPTVNGDTVIYLGREKPHLHSPSPNAIFSYDLKTDKDVLLTTSEYGENGVICCHVVSTHWLTWITYSQPGNGTDWRVYVKNLRSGAETVLERAEDANRGGIWRGPFTAIWGDMFVWSSLKKTGAKNYHSTITLKQLTTGRQEVIAQADSPESVFGEVSLDGSHVVWSTTRVDGTHSSADVMLYDMATCVTTQVTHDGQSIEPQVNGRYVAWRTGFGDVAPVIVQDLKANRRTALGEQGGWLQLGDGLLIWHQWTNNSVALYDIIRYQVDSIVAKPTKYSNVVTIAGRTVVLVQQPDDFVNGTGVIEIRSYP